MIKDKSFVYAIFLKCSFVKFFSDIATNSRGGDGHAVTSIHSDSIQEVHEVPIDVITRPLVSELNDEKVKSIMITLEVRLLVTNYI